MPKAKNTDHFKIKLKNDPLNRGSQKQIVKNVNSLIMGLKDFANELNIPEFGSGLYGNIDRSGNIILPDNHTVVASTIADRITGKFESPDFSAEQRLRRECNEAWIAYESDHLSTRKWSDVGSETRSVIYKARDLVYQWLNGYSNGRYCYENSFFKFIEDAPIAFGPGESFISKNGDVSTFSKLDPFNATVTEDCLQEAALFISINKGLRSIFNEVFRMEDYRLKAKARASGYKYVKPFDKTEKTKKFGFKITVFAARVVSFLIREKLVQRGSRGSSVYKNSQKRRFINVECFLNVVLQKVAGWSLRQCLKTNAKCDLDLGQDLHKALISQPGWSTVDWSNASDSILTWLVQQLLAKNKRVYKILDRTRSQFVLIDTPFVNPEGKSDHLKLYHHPHKFSSMGNGFTFELLTLVNLAIVRVLDPDATVYGDDVILRSVYANDFITHMTAVGFVPNLKKSFINKPFRESCGGFFLDGYGYIRSYDFKWNFNIADCIITCNKLGRIIRENPDWEHRLKQRIVETHEEVMRLIPAALSGPLTSSSDLPVWAEKKGYRRAHMSNPFCKKKWEAYSTVATEMAEMLKFTELEEKGYNPGSFVVIMVPELRKKVKIHPQRANVHSARLIYSYIMAGICSPMLYRLSKDEYEFAFKPTLVHSEGWSVRVGTARRITVQNRGFIPGRESDHGESIL